MEWFNVGILKAFVAGSETSMDRLDAMSVFLEVVEMGSLASAARKLGRSPASVTRAIAQLEEQAGERLVERTTRSLSVTEAGERHAHAYRRVLAELAGLEGSSADIDVRGTVTVTAPELFGRLKVLPLVESFLSAFPHVQVRLLLVNRIVDLVGEGVNVAVRLAELPDSSMKAIRVGEMRKLTCAAPAYLRKHEEPAHPTELARHFCIGLGEAGNEELWQFREPGSARRLRSVRITTRLTVTNASASIDAAERGLGIIRPMSYQVERQILEGALVPLLQQYEPDPLPIHLVFPQAPSGGTAVRAFIDHAVQALRQR